MTSYIRACWLGTAVVLSAVGVPQTARAATVTVSQFFQLPLATGGGNPTQSVVFYVPQFDATAGTLDAVEFTLVRGLLNFSWTVDSETPATTALTSAESAARTQLAWLGGVLSTFYQLHPFGPPYEILAADSDGVPDFVGSDTHTFFGAFPLLAEDVTLTDAALLPAFIGAGQVPLEMTVLFLPSSPGPGIFFHDATLSVATGGVVWRYHYTPSSDPPGEPVPEPGILLVLAGGLICAAHRGATRRRYATSYVSRTMPDDS